MEDTLHTVPDPEEQTTTTEPTETDQLRKERDEYLDGWQRARAELANYKKEEGKRSEDMMRFANNALIRELIGVMDNFGLAIASMEQHGEVEKGVYLIKAQLGDILKQQGLEKMTVEVGQQFDPAIHDAIASVPSELDSGCIVQEVDSGYYLHGKLIRPARVTVAQ